VIGIYGSDVAPGLARPMEAKAELKRLLMHSGQRKVGKIAHPAALIVSDAPSRTGRGFGWLPGAARFQPAVARNAPMGAVFFLGRPTQARRVRARGRSLHASRVIYELAKSIE
jgi:hypothetical protein